MLQINGYQPLPVWLYSSIPLLQNWCPISILYLAFFGRFNPWVVQACLFFLENLRVNTLRLMLKTILLNHCSTELPTCQLDAPQRAPEETNHIWLEVWTSWEQPRFHQASQRMTWVYLMLIDHLHCLFWHMAQPFR